MGRRVLVISEYRYVGEYLQLVLESEGYEVEQADDLDHASRSVAQSRPDLVLFDLYGEEAFSSEQSEFISTLRWRAEHSDIPAILMVGDLSPANWQRACEAFDHVLERHEPDVDLLLRLVSELLLDDDASGSPMDQG